MPGITKIGVSNVAGGTLANGQVSNVRVNGAPINVKGDGPHAAHGIGVHAVPFSTVGSSNGYINNNDQNWFLICCQF